MTPKPVQIKMESTSYPILSKIIISFKVMYSRNSKTMRMSPFGQRFQNLEVSHRLFVPGPGTYNPRDYADLKNDRVYYLSQFKNPQTRRFGTAHRQRNDRNTAFVPGPGQYRPPSEFGYLDMIKSPRTQTSPRGMMSGTLGSTTRPFSSDTTAGDSHMKSR